MPLSLLALAFFACTSDDKPDGGTAADTGGGGDATTGADGGGLDADPPDTGPLPCLRDQGGEANRGCDPGQVCNLTTGLCVAGRTCTQDSDCNPCSDLQNAEDCGHGYNLVAWCDPAHGNVCARSKAPCEPCQTNEECGRPHPNLPLGDFQCVDYGGGEKYCGRPCTLGCPDGFVCDSTSSQCKRAAGCEPEPVICPAGPCGASSDQICAGDECPGTGGARCSTNDQPGSLGLCIGFCTDNSDCPDNLPICNRANGICISGCTMGSCPGGQVCHADGFCAAPCADDQACVDRFDGNHYCNKPGQPPPRYYKGYRDRDSCAELGCERPEDCASAGRVCDKSLAPPACVEGCYDSDDCLSGFLCKDGPQGSYDRAGCRALPEKSDPMAIGVCCNPGCTNRVTQCAINDYCCGEPDSPYEDPNSCLTLTSTSNQMAEPGECFQMATVPWCIDCTMMGAAVCNSGWMPGYNTDPNINGGQPFQEQEFCFGVTMNMGLCGVTCNPEAVDRACPSGWQCKPYIPGCFQNADCNGLECIGADSMNMVPGKCKCGENGQATAMCPTAYATVDVAVTNPRCIDYGTAGDMVCIAAFNCVPPFPSMAARYPAACNIQ